MRYSVPWALSMVATGSAAVVDGISWGVLPGQCALAAVNLAVPAWSLVSGMGFMLVTGGSVRSGRYMGEGRPEEASAMCIKTFMALAAVMLLVCGVMYLRLDDVLDILGAGGDANELRALCREYLSTVLLFCPVFPLSYGMSYFIRVDGRPLLASAGLGAAALCNIMLDALLVGLCRHGRARRGPGHGAGLPALLPCADPAFFFRFAPTMSSPGGSGAGRRFFSRRGTELRSLSMKCRRASSCCCSTSFSWSGWEDTVWLRSPWWLMPVCWE